MRQGAPEHWVDRLATASVTRRDGLRGALAALLALTLPLPRVPLAYAENPNSNGDPHACQKGCTFSSHLEYSAKTSSCESRYDAQVSLNVLTMGAGYIGFAAGVGANFIALSICNDRALLRHKAEQFDCLKPNCPGYDPTKGEWGPCTNCSTTPGYQCCPDSTSATGYTCCDGNVGYCCGTSGGCVSCGK